MSRCAEAKLPAQPYCGAAELKADKTSLQTEGSCCIGQWNLASESEIFLHCTSDTEIHKFTKLQSKSAEKRSVENVSSCRLLSLTMQLSVVISATTNQLSLLM